MFVEGGEESCYQRKRGRKTRRGRERVDEERDGEGDGKGVTEGEGEEGKEKAKAKERKRECVWAIDRRSKRYESEIPSTSSLSLSQSAQQWRERFFLRDLPYPTWPRSGREGGGCDGEEQRKRGERRRRRGERRVEMKRMRWINATANESGRR